MSNIVEDINIELKDLCRNYVNILQNLKDKGIINKETFERCTNSKKIFIEE